MKYDQMARRLQGLACIVGPLLMLAATLSFVAGNQAVEGVIGFYGMVLFIPTLFATARMIGERMRYYGIVCVIIGLFAGAAGASGMVMRVVYIALLRADVIDPTAINNFDAAMEALFYGNSEILLIFIPALLWPVAHVLHGIGLMRVGSALRWSGILLIAGGICFFVAQALLIALQITYPLSLALLLAGYAPIGLRLLRSEQPPAT